MQVFLHTHLCDTILDKSLHFIVIWKYTSSAHFLPFICKNATDIFNYVRGESTHPFLLFCQLSLFCCLLSATPTREKNTG